MAMASITPSALQANPEALTLKLPGLPTAITAVRNSAISQQITTSPDVVAALASEAVAAVASPEDGAVAGVATTAGGAAVEAPTVAEPSIWVGDVDGARPGYSAVVFVSSESGETAGYIRSVDPDTGTLTLYLVSP